MAGSLRSLCRFNLVLPSNVFLRATAINGARFIYTEKSLGITAYETTRLNFRNQFMNVENAFREKMQDVCKEESSMIFTEDLKAMVHLMQKKEEDVQLVVQMLEKFNGQNKELRFGSFIFGPVVMRAFYYLDEPDIAFAAFNNPKLKDLFDQHASYQILMSLLHKHNKHNDLRSVFEIVKSKYMDNEVFPKNPLNILMASCYKENTPESLEYALKTWRELTEKGHTFTRRGIMLLACLALKQGKPHIAIESLTILKETRYVGARCLKIMSYTAMDRFLDILPILRLSLESVMPNQRKETYFSDVIANLETQLERVNYDKNNEIYGLIEALKENGHINETQTLEGHVTEPIDFQPFRRLRERNESPVRDQQQQSRGGSSRTFNNRLGLRDLL